MKKTSAILSVLVLVGSLARVPAAEPGAKSEMKDMRLVEGGTFPMGDVFDEGVRFASPVHDTIGI